LTQARGLYRSHRVIVDIDVNVDVDGVTGVVSGAEDLHEIAFRAGLRELDDVHL
jgi:hypothetical protein